MRPPVGESERVCRRRYRAADEILNAITEAPPLVVPEFLALDEEG
jgi:hypothetical protein